jgi:hypothetical protein
LSVINEFDTQLCQPNYKRKIYQIADAAFGNLYIVVISDAKINYQLLKLR